MKINPEVLKAIQEGKPVVALESTIISHGMPYPRNVECALAVEKTVRDNGAVPATIGIIEGEPIIGMTPDEIEEFGKKKGIIKVSRRDIPIVTAMKLWGATTVSATMIFANLAGINFFVTGGIGGCQRGATKTFDISADLDELGKTNVTVICAGPKAILDLPLTLEYLETKGVPVISYQSETLPRFYTRTSTYKPDYNRLQHYCIFPNGTNAKDLYLLFHQKCSLIRKQINIIILHFYKELLVLSSICQDITQKNLFLLLKHYITVLEYF